MKIVGRKGDENLRGKYEMNCLVEWVFKLSDVFSFLISVILLTLIIILGVYNLQIVTWFWGLF